MSLSQTRLRELLHYNPRTGIFTWRVNGRGRFMRAGTRAGTIRKNGYRQICIDCVLYQSSRLAWLYMTGKWPKQLIDHRNRIKNDDRWNNLRSANYSQNGANNIAKGFEFTRGKYQARIKVNYQNIYLGRFDTAKQAHAAYLAAARKYFDTFARAR